MRIIGYVLLFVVIWFWIQIEISSQSPCSNFSKTPSLCNSDQKEDIK